MDLSRTELADLVGLTYRRIYDIDKTLPEEKRMFQKTGYSKYDASAFIKNWVAYNVAKATGEGADLTMIKTRHELIKSQKTELQVAKLRGDVVEVADVKKLWGNIANTVMQNLIHMPHRIAPMLIMRENTDEISEIIEDEVRRILEEMTEVPLPEYAAEDEDESEGE